MASKNIGLGLVEAGNSVLDTGAALRRMETNMSIAESEAADLPLPGGVSRAQTVVDLNKDGQGRHFAGDDRRQMHFDQLEQLEAQLQAKEEEEERKRPRRTQSMISAISEFSVSDDPRNHKRPSGLQRSDSMISAIAKFSGSDDPRNKKRPSGLQRSGSDVNLLRKDSLGSKGSLDSKRPSGLNLNRSSTSMGIGMDSKSSMGPSLDSKGSMGPGLDSKRPSSVNLNRSSSSIGALGGNQRSQSGIDAHSIAPAGSEYFKRQGSHISDASDPQSERGLQRSVSDINHSTRPSSRNRRMSTGYVVHVLDSIWNFIFYTSRNKINSRGIFL